MLMFSDNPAPCPRCGATPVVKFKEDREQAIIHCPNGHLHATGRTLDSLMKAWEEEICWYQRKHAC